MRLGIVTLLLLVLTGCSVIKHPSYEEMLGWASTQGLSVEGAVRENSMTARLKLNERCDGLLVSEAEDAYTQGKYRLKIVKDGEELDVVEESKVKAFAEDFKKGNITTKVKDACLLS